MSRLNIPRTVDTDSYKLSHPPQYPRGTRVVSSYLESRGGLFEEMVAYGALNYYLDELFSEPIRKQDIDYGEEFTAAHLGDAKLFNREGWERILKNYGGYLPLEIRAVPEGTVLPVHNALLTVENLEFPGVQPEWWLTNFMETRLTQTWYPYTVATQTYHIRKVILAFLEATGTPEDIWFKLHDFGFRGVSSAESAAIGASAHQVCFKGSDTIPGIILAREYYMEPMSAFSIPASEHSTITSWGKSREAQAYLNMLRTYQKGLVACVSDSYDVFNAVANIWGDELRAEVMGREGTLVIRPDSGDPVSVILRLLAILKQKFPVTVNSKGYKVLDSHVRLIQGDGVNMESIRAILQAMKDAGWSADNIAFGMGGALLQQLNRDTMKFAFKCSRVIVNEDGNSMEREVFKDPITDHGKRSKAGWLTAATNGKDWITCDRRQIPEGFVDGMVTMYTMQDLAHRGRSKKFASSFVPLQQNLSTFQQVRDRVLTKF